MKKVALLSLVLILLAVSVVPVMAAGGPPNGHGNGVSAGQGNNGENGDKEKQRERDQERLKDRDSISNPGSGGNGHHEHNRMRTPFYLQGTILAVDSAGTITVTLTHGNAQVKQYIGTTLAIQTNKDTLIFRITQGEETEEGTDRTTAPTTNSELIQDESDSNRVSIPIDQLEATQKVAIHGNLVDGVYMARLVTVYIKTQVGQPAVEEP
jgi:hypothetical protein